MRLPRSRRAVDAGTPPLTLSAWTSNALPSSVEMAPRATAMPLVRLGVALLVTAALSACSSWTTTPVCLAGAKLGGTGACKAQRAPLHRIPFRAGVETEVLQAYHGYRTHKKDLAFSVDYSCSPGTPVVASRSGKVWAIRENSDEGCNDPSCIDEGNYVVVDHGDGTFSEYHHLQLFGALVEPGDQVCRGEIVGLCGNTGYTSGPHLHFAVTDVSRRTVPSRTSPRPRERYPYPVPETTYTSRNDRDAPCPSTEYSRLPRDAFAHEGIILQKQLPMVVRRGRTESRIVGHYRGDNPKVALHRKHTESGEWIDECVPVDDDGRFAARVRWPKDRFDAGFHWLMLTGADEDCHSPGWAWSYKLRVL